MSQSTSVNKLKLYFSNRFTGVLSHFFRARAMHMRILAQFYLSTSTALSNIQPPLLIACSSMHLHTRARYV